MWTHTKGFAATGLFLEVGDVGSLFVSIRLPDRVLELHSHLSEHIGSAVIFLYLVKASHLKERRLRTLCMLCFFEVHGG
jgi:hypothetical protein